MNKEDIEYFKNKFEKSSSLEEAKRNCRQLCMAYESEIIYIETRHNALVKASTA